MNCDYRRYVKRFVTINTAVIILVVTIAYVVMGIVKENYSEKEILNNYENILYGSALKDGGLLKLDIVKKKKPSVIALGSSRVMQFRADFFQNQDFYTLGGLGASVCELEYTWKKVKESYSPKVVIIGVDSWWLNPKLKHDNRFNDSNNKAKYKEIVELYRNEKIFKQLLRVDEIKEFDEIGSRRNIGLDAAVNGNGYRLSDGSRQYGKIIRDKKDTETRFKSTYERMAKGDENDRFVWCDTVSEIELRKLENLLNDIKKSGAIVVVFLPPFPHEIYNYMDNNSHYHGFLHNFIYRMDEMCDKLNIPCYNFSDLSSIGASDDETIDGFHASEVAYARITALLGQYEPISKYINTDKLNVVIRNPIDSMQAIPASR